MLRLKSNHVCEKGILLPKVSGSGPQLKGDEYEYQCVW